MNKDTLDFESHVRISIKCEPVEGSFRLLGNFYKLDWV